MGNMEQFPTILIPSALQPAIASGTDAVQQVLQQTKLPAGIHHRAPQGHSEPQFNRDLWQYFPGKIHTGLLIEHPGCNQPYVPDFAYIDPHLNLHIDIEVDEPYTHDRQKPLHYLNCPKDQQRNHWFLAAGWVVIRFSELQVVKCSLSCCKTIASTIATITGDNTIMAPFRQVPSLKPDRRWTAAEAADMAATAHRSTYLAANPVPTAPKTGRRRRADRKAQPQLMTTNLTFYCPICGDGPIRWQGHYIQCPTCRYDAFVF